MPYINPKFYSANEIPILRLYYLPQSILVFSCRSGFWFIGLSCVSLSLSANQFLFSFQPQFCFFQLLSPFNFILHTKVPQVLTLWPPYQRSAPQCYLVIHVRPRVVLKLLSPPLCFIAFPDAIFSHLTLNIANVSIQWPPNAWHSTLMFIKLTN